MKSRYIVKISQERMPASCWGRYGRVAVMEMEEGAPYPPMISIRAKGCIRIVRAWGKLFWGKSAACALRRAQQEANALAAELNSKEVEK